MTAVALSIPPLVLLGAGGHAKVLLSLARACGHDVLGVCDPSLAASGDEYWRGIKVLGGDDALEQMDVTQVGLINGVGQTAGGQVRRRLYERWRLHGFRFPVLIHPFAWVDPTAVLAEGVQVMCGAVIQADTTVGGNTIVNTRASLDHDCRVGAHVHLAPGTTVCGGVCLADEAFLGCGATILPGVNIGLGAIVGAGTVALRDVPARGKLIGPSPRLR